MAPSYEYRDGEMREVEDVVLTESAVLYEPVSRTVIIEAGAQVTTHGTISGTVEVRDGQLDAVGPVSGTVNVARGATAHFSSRMSGTLVVRPGGKAHLRPGAVATGTMIIDGVLVNEGTRGVQVSGVGTVEDRAGSAVREPDELWDDGTAVYYG